MHSISVLHTFTAYRNPIIFHRTGGAEFESKRSCVTFYASAVVSANSVIAYAPLYRISSCIRELVYGLLPANLCARERERFLLFGGGFPLQIRISFFVPLLVCKSRVFFLQRVFDSLDCTRRRPSSFLSFAYLFSALSSACKMSSEVESPSITVSNATFNIHNFTIWTRRRIATPNSPTAKLPWPRFRAVQLRSALLPCCLQHHSSWTYTAKPIKL